MYIAFEGIDGSGKTTVASVLSDYLREQGKDVLQIRMPGCTSFGQFIRANWHKNKKVRFLSLLANHVEVLEDLVVPHLDKGGWVVQDRTYLSSHVYFGYDDSLNHSLITSCSRHWINRTPDRMFVLDASAEVAEHRLSLQMKDLPDPSRKELAELRLAYIIESGVVPNSHIIDTSNMLLSEVFEECRRVLKV